MRLRQLAILGAALTLLGPTALYLYNTERGKPAPPGCTVIMGASIAAGYRAEPETNWPTLVIRQLTALDPGACLTDHSVSATRLLLTTPGLPSYLDREPAALEVPRLTRIVLTDLINDIQALPHQYDPQTIIAGIRRFVTTAHDRGVRVIATTMTPYGGYHYTAEQSYSAAGEHCRQVVNAALRQGHLVDGIIDFDRVLADPGRSNRLRPEYDSGDHLHPSTAGHRAMADSATPALRLGDPQARHPDENDRDGRD
jgi:lysophospholipase L1-like esterase